MEKITEEKIEVKVDYTNYFTNKNGSYIGLRRIDDGKSKTSKVVEK